MLAWGMTTKPEQNPAPTPERVFQALWAFHQTNALRAAIELGLFTAIGSGVTTAAALARELRAQERGVRILCDFLAIHGFLSKSGANYGLAPVAAAFLDKRSPTYMGTMADFLCDAEVQQTAISLARIVREGGDERALQPNWEGWLRFARSMTPMMAPQAAFIAERHAGQDGGKVLDIAAGHGLYGLALARRNPRLEIVAVDWPAVLEIAKENAAKAGIGADRYRVLPGSALEVDFGSGYRLALLTNILHQFDAATCVRLLRRVHAALAPGGKVLALEFVPNEDRISPPMPASFSMEMLLHTPAGDAYTWAEYVPMLEQAGFRDAAVEPVPHSPQSLISAVKS